MKLQNYIYQCGVCKNEFKAPELIGDAYGEFLMRNAKGDIVYLNSFDDPVFNEVEKLFKNCVKLEQLNNAKLFQTILSVACDPSLDGDFYCIRNKPLCPNCGSNKMLSWEGVYPQEIVEVDVPNVTHECWNKLSAKEKQDRVKEAIEKVLKDFLK